MTAVVIISPEFAAGMLGRTAGGTQFSYIQDGTQCKATLETRAAFESDFAAYEPFDTDIINLTGKTIVQ